MATEEPIVRSQDNVTMDHRYRGYLYDLQRPRIPITGPIGFRADEKKYPLPNSLVRGHPVLPPTPATGFFFGSENIRDLSENERRENRVNLKMLNKTSAEVRRQRRQAEEQADFIRMHKAARKHQEALRRKEQEDDLKQLNTYFPFGKPGYGAPRSGKAGMTKSLQSKDGVGIVIESGAKEPTKVDWKQAVPPGAPGRPKVRRYEDDQMRRYAVSRDTARAYKKELDDLREIKRKNEEKIELVEKARESEMFSYDPFGKPGAGAPNRDDKGHSSTRRSVSLSYMNNPVDARHAEIVTSRKSLEQKQPSPRQQAEENEGVAPSSSVSFGNEADGKAQVVRKFNLKTPVNKENQAAFGPGNVQAGRKFKQHTPANKENQEAFDPWEKDAPRIDSKGNARRFPRAGDNGIYEFVDQNVPGEVFPRKHIGGGGEPLFGDKGEILTKRMGNLTTIHGARRTENIPRVATPDLIRHSSDKQGPWGKPGAGAPLKDEEGHVVKNTKGTIDKERKNITQSEASMRARAKEIYRSQLQEGMVMQRNLREQEKEFLMRPPGDVPSWFSKGKVGRPTRDPETGLIQPQKRIMSDVTAQKLAADRPRDVESYYRDLKEQADERRRMRVKERERIAQLESKHFGNFNSYFRKPGHGAPKKDGRNRRMKFSTSALHPQPQTGTKMPVSLHKTSLESALYLPYCHDSMSQVLQNNVTDDVTFDHDVFMSSNERTDSAKCNVGTAEMSESEQHQEREEAGSENPPETCVRFQVPPEKDSSPICPAVLEGKECAKDTDQKPFPYRVVAPWAID